MRILVLAESPDHVCCRYRAKAFRSILESAGHEFTIQSLPANPLARLHALRRARLFDVSILLRKLLSPLELWVLRKSARKLIYDFDDAMWLRDSYSRKGFESRKRRSRWRRIIQDADAIVPGNAILADEAQRVCTLPSRIHIIPTCVDVHKYPPTMVNSSTSNISLVWIGSSSTLRGLVQQTSLWEALGRAIPGLRMKVICDTFPHFQHLAVDEIPWREDTEASELSHSDIGIGWVPDDPWSRGKCGLKLLQYQAAGLPVVANPVGVQQTIVQHGTNGFLATTHDEWIHAIRELVLHPQRRHFMGLAGRAQVESQYSVEVGGRLWVNLLAQLS